VSSARESEDRSPRNRRRSLPRFQQVVSQHVLGFPTFVGCRLPSFKSSMPSQCNRWYRCLDGECRVMSPAYYLATRVTALTLAPGHGSFLMQGWMMHDAEAFC
jgi:hypothetical protein